MVNQYEIELKIRGGMQERIITRTEHAYDVKDALSQALYNIGAELPIGEEILKILHIGPPAELVRASALAVAQSVEEAMKIIARKK